jgi:flagellar biosynthesis protein FliQ
MTADQVAELMRMTLREALLLSAPILIVAGVSAY